MDTHSTPRPNLGLTLGLIFLSIVPSLAGIARLVGLANGGEAVNASNARFYTMPVPVIIHVIAALIYCLLGAFQFAPVRRNNITWHRLAGRVLAVMGLLAALSGLWMTLFYGIPAELQGTVLFVVRLFVGAGMAFSLVLAWVTIRQKDVPSHRAWMIRAYALGQGAGTQVLVMLPPALLLGSDIHGLPRDLLMSVAWVINLLVAEWVIRRQASNSRPARQRKIFQPSPVSEGED